MEVRAGIPGRNLEQGLKRNHRGGLLTDLLFVAFSACFDHSTQEHHPRHGTTHSELVLPHKPNQENVPMGNLMEAFSQLRFPFTDTYNFVKLTK